MTRHLLGFAGALVLLPLAAFGQQPTEASPPAAPTAGYRSVLKRYVRPEVPKSSPDKEWLTANRALLEDGRMDMGGMQMEGAESPKPAATKPADPHAGQQLKDGGH